LPLTKTKSGGSQIPLAKVLFASLSPPEGFSFFAILFLSPLLGKLDDLVNPLTPF